MNNDKSPGIDGFSTNFYKVFWGKIGHFVVRVLNYAFIENSFSHNIKLGTIVCIPKEKKPRQFLKNLRPITLLNILYKLTSGSIANRIKSVLNQLISKEQTGVLKGRFIGENTRLVYDIMQYCEERNIPGLLMLIDFEKTFDSISFRFIEKTLLFFNFGETIRKWVKMFLYNTDVCVQLNGFSSNFFTVKRGCCQGDPISAYIFILCAEILNIKLKNNKNIKGIHINNEEYIISQFADDTTLFLDGSDKSLRNTLKLLEEFSHISGLKVNFEKTKLVWIGSMKYSTRSIKTKWKLSWGEIQFKILGITFHVNLRNMVNINFEPKIQSIKNSIAFWKRRKLTPFGKIAVVKSILVPTLTHLFLSLPSPTKEYIKRIGDNLYNFVWDGACNRIKKIVLMKNYEEGGLKMLDLYNYNLTMKIKWLKNLVSEGNKDCYEFTNNIFDINKLFNSGIKYCETLCKAIKNDFWRDVLGSFKIYVSKCNFTTWSEVINMPLFYNENLRIGSKHFFNSTLYIMV